MTPKPLNKISILGAGSFGLALAKALASKAGQVSIWSRSLELVNKLNQNHRHPSKLKNITMSPEAVVDYSLKALKKNKVVCIPGLMNKVMAKILPSLPRNMYYRLAAKMVEI